MQPFCSLGSVNFSGGVGPLDLGGIGWMDNAVFVVELRNVGKGGLYLRKLSVCVLLWSGKMLRADDTFILQRKFTAMLAGTLNRQRVQIAYRNRVYSEYVLHQKMRA